VDLIAERRAKAVVTWGTPLLAELELLFKGLGIGATTVEGTDEGSRAETRKALISANLGITEADFAIADIGALVLLSGERQSRLVSLLPPVHVALVRATAVVPTLAHLLPLLGEAGPEAPGPLASAVTFISGPSRTADIEANRVIGIHGPIEVHAVILEYL
jgi:L-lactate dehydrogenase complex protein LldG